MTGSIYSHFVCEAYQLICELKLLLLKQGRKTADENMRTTILGPLMAIKRSAIFYNLREISAFCERMETIFCQALKGGNAKVELIDSMLLACDRLKALLIDLENDRKHYHTVVKLLGELAISMGSNQIGAQPTPKEGTL